jgi:3-oxoadipate CoA-transferase beta subunit
MLTRPQIAWRAAQDLLDGQYVNLGIGLPLLAAAYLPPDREIIFHSENGILGLGPPPGPDQVDLDIINAGKALATVAKGGAFFNHEEAFLMIRGGHLDVALMGAFEVSERGDLANWTTDDPIFPPGVGGAMDLAAGARHVRIMIEHTTKSGMARLRRNCSYPLTAAGCVERIYTDLAVIDVVDQGFLVREISDDIDRKVLQDRTDAPLIFAPDLRGLRAPLLG